MESASARGPAHAGMHAPRLGLRRPLSDARLSRLAARGDSRAFEAIFERYHQELYRYCRAILGDSDEAQDALQNTMAAALRALPGEGREIALRPWLYRVAHNEAISLTRRRRELPPPAPDADQAGTSPGLEIEDRERLRELVADLSALPDRQRGALVMRELSGLSYGAIATALGASEAAARQAVYEAREAIREAKRGREMECGDARRAISDRDGRILRGRALRAHLRHCEPCRDFRAGISQRRADLPALAPPLPALAASGLLAGALGGGASGTGSGAALSGAATSGGTGLSGIGGSVLGASALAKGSAVVAALAFGTGAAALSGAVDLPLVGGSADGTEASSASHSRGAAEETNVHGVATGDAASAGAGSPPGHETHGNGNGPGVGSGQDQAPGNGPGQGQLQSQTAPGAAGSQGRGVPAGGSDGVAGPPAHANGNGPPATAGTGVGNAGGNSATSSGSSADPPRSAQGAAHSNAGAGTPPTHAGAGGNGNGGELVEQ
jgi:RNA polymerase sigma factor (sigma-70 family)